MFNWLSDNLSSIIVAAILVVIVVIIIRKLIRDKKSGKGTCGCGCSTCAMQDSCHNKKS